MHIVFCLQMDLKTKEELGVTIHEASASSCRALALFPHQRRLAVSIGNAMLLAIRILGAAAQLAAKVKAVHNILMLLQPNLP